MKIAFYLFVFWILVQSETSSVNGPLRYVSEINRKRCGINLETARSYIEAGAQIIGVGDINC